MDHLRLAKNQSVQPTRIELGGGESPALSVDTSSSDNDEEDEEDFIVENIIGHHEVAPETMTSRWATGVTMLIMISLLTPVSTGGNLWTFDHKVLETGEGVYWQEQVDWGTLHCYE